MALSEPTGDPAAGGRRPNPMRGRVVARGETPASYGNVANIVTVARILVAPLFIWMLLADAGEMGGLRYAAAVLFIAAIATDAVDGRLARGRNLVTDVGKIIDPIADKILTGGALVALSILGELPWWVTIVIVVREVGITVWRFIALRDRVIPADTLGKAKTVVQSFAISFALVPFAHLLGWDSNPFNLFFVVNAILMGAALVLTVASGLQYLYNYWRTVRAERGV